VFLGVLFVCAANARAADIGGSISSTLTITEDSQLVDDVACTVTGAPCIAISALHVTLELNGFSMTGQAEQVKMAASDSSANLDCERVSSSLEAKKQEYDQRVTVARRRLLDLFRRFLLEDEFVSRPYAIDQLSLAGADLEAAARQFPLGAEANALQALVASRRNDFRIMHSSFRSRGVPWKVIPVEPVQLAFQTELK
jgi:hypothetical protein